MNCVYCNKEIRLHKFGDNTNNYWWHWDSGLQDCHPDKQHNEKRAKPATFGLYHKLVK